MSTNGQVILVPGGAGFLGSHLCERLLALGYEVIALDDLSTGDFSNVSHLQAHPHFNILICDVTQPLPGAAEKALRIFNLACPASPAHYQTAPVQTALTSALGAWRLLDLAMHNGARILQASTSEVYGDPQISPQSESYSGHVNPIGPRSCYDEGKRFAEALFFAYRREWKVSMRIGRLFNCYGPRLRPGDGRVVSNFIVQALRGDPITIYGDGLQTRSFCYVDDTVEGLLRLMDADIEGPVNIGNPCETTVLELAELVLRLTGSRSILELRPLPPDDPRRRCPDISLARQTLDWGPHVCLEDGLYATIDYFQHELELRRRKVFVSAGGRASEKNIRLAT